MNTPFLDAGTHYRHYKGGEYELVDIATHTETGEELAIYRACYGDKKLWARPKDMFFGFVGGSDTKQPRFSRQTVE